PLPGAPEAAYEPNQMAPHFASVGSHVFAAISGKGLFRSDDHGRTWSAVAARGLFRPFDAYGLIAAGPALLVADFNTTLESVDLGATWPVLGHGLPRGDVGAVVESGPAVVAVTGESGVFRFARGSWSPATGLSSAFGEALAAGGDEVLAGMDN